MRSVVNPSDIGRWIIHDFETLDSTSDQARRMVEAGGLRLPFVVRTSRQTKGRGRGSNTWWSDEGSLTVTLVLDPSVERLDRDRDALIALIGAYTLLDVTWDLVKVKPAVRWPNDVEAGGRKLAGFLCERVETRDGPRILLGMGVNIRTRFEGSPQDVLGLATSLEAIGWPDGPALDPSTLLHNFVGMFDNYLAHSQASPAEFSKNVNRHDALLGQQVRVLQGSTVVEGIGRGINPDGSLRLERDGGIVAIYGGQVLRS
jgi:BirA family transcriptional regulator, biotin operon repressor / biotin---[acetyl-CoA-carboxylase] ligase